MPQNVCNKPMRGGEVLMKKGPHTRVKGKTTGGSGVGRSLSTRCGYSDCVRVGDKMAKLQVLPMTNKRKKAINNPS